MADPSRIQYLQRDQIDIAKWDRCVDTAANRLIYGCSFYLDRMARHWDALICGDYEAVMPLTWNKKHSFTYLYQPFLTAQLGIFGKNITEDLVNKFIQAIPASFRLIEISLNSGNICRVQAGFSIHRSNYTIDLNKPYDELYKEYRDNSKRNIKKALSAGCTAIKNFDAEKVIGLALAQMRTRSRESDDNIARFRELYQYLHDRKMVTTYGIVSAENELLASCIFFLDHGRAYYILVGNDPASKTTGASHALIDAFIKDHAGTEMLLDFEGSDIHSLAFFYSSFGAHHEIYPALRINRLPFYLKWLKR